MHKYIYYLIQLHKYIYYLIQLLGNGTHKNSRKVRSGDTSRRESPKSKGTRETRYSSKWRRVIQEGYWFYRQSRRPLQEMRIACIKSKQCKTSIERKGRLMYSSFSSFFYNTFNKRLYYTYYALARVTTGLSCLQHLTFLVHKMLQRNGLRTRALFIKLTTFIMLLDMVDSHPSFAIPLLKMSIHTWLSKVVTKNNIQDFNNKGDYR